MERDSEGVDHTLWRKYESRSGRWTSPDPYGGSMDISDPQSFNRYVYVSNDPINLVDPIGLDWQDELGPPPVMPPPNPWRGGTVERVVVNVWADEPATRGLGFLSLRQYIRSEPQNPAPSLTDAVNAARNALQNNEACRNLFSKGNGLDLLNKLNKKGKIKIGDTGIPKNLSPTGRLKDAPGVAGYAKDGKIFLNPSSSITKGTVNPRASVFGGMSSVDALATLVIHEALHVSGDFPPEKGDFYREESIANSQEVKSACFPGYPSS